MEKKLQLKKINWILKEIRILKKCVELYPSEHGNERELERLKTELETEHGLKYLEK